MQNSRQMPKNIEPHTVADSPTVSLVRAPMGNDTAKAEVIQRTVERVSQIANAGSSVYFLARFKHGAFGVNHGRSWASV